MRPISINTYGYKVCYTVGKSKGYTRKFITHSFKKAKEMKDHYYTFPPFNLTKKALKQLKWYIFPISKKEVLRGIWREPPF